VSELVTETRTFAINLADSIQDNKMQNVFVWRRREIGEFSPNMSRGEYARSVWRNIDKNTSGRYVFAINIRRVKISGINSFFVNYCIAPLIAGER